MITYDNEIKVLLVSPVPPPAGGDSTWARKYIDYCNELGLPLFHVNTSMIGKRSISTSDTISLWDEIKRCFRIWNNISRILKSEKIDVCHFNCNCSPRGMVRDLISIKKIARKKIKIVLHCRCNVKDQVSKSPNGLSLFIKLAKKSNVIFVQNKESYEFVKSLTKTNVMIMPNFIEDDLVATNKAVKQSLNSIVYIGHIRKTKGIDEIVEVSKKYPSYKFILVGPVTEDYTNNYFSQFKNIVLVGDQPHERIIDYLDDADLFLFPTYTEGFSNSLLEAMARGVPVVTTNVGANEDMLENVGGYLVNPKDVEGLCNKIKDIESYETRLFMSSWNIRKVKENYALQTVFNKIRNIYRCLVNEDDN